MSEAQDRGRLDWLVELAGAAAPACAAVYAAAKLAPIAGWTASIAVLVGGLGTFAAAFVAMRLIPSEGRHLPLAEFEHAVLEDELLLDQPVGMGELLLDQPLLVDGMDAVAELLLDDPLLEPAPDSRVVQLFADGRMPSAGQLKSRIDRHLADGRQLAPAGDASDALSEALAELRRSLR